jgi:hypothetical protein
LRHRRFRFCKAAIGGLIAILQNFSFFENIRSLKVDRWQRRPQSCILGFLRARPRRERIFGARRRSGARRRRARPDSGAVAHLRGCGAGSGGFFAAANGWRF